MTTPNIDELIDRLYDWHNTSAEQNRLDMQKAADLLQSQAERIKELEAENGKLSDLWSAMKAKRDTLRAELNTTEVLLEECKMGWSGDVTQIKAEHKHVIDQRKAELPVLPEPSVCAGENYGEWTFEVDHFTKSKTEAYGQQCAAQARELALSEAVEQVTTLYEGDEAPYLIDICKAIEALKGKR